MKIKKLILGSAILSSVYGCRQENNLTENDFLNCKWALCENYEAVRRTYMGENIERNKENYSSYMYYLDCANNGNVVGKIWFPDIDSNGKIIENFIVDTTNYKIEKTPIEWVSGEKLFEKLENGN